jgi:hypothetical protein
MPTRYIGGEQTAELTFTNQTFDVYDCTKSSAAGSANQARFHVQIGPPKIDFPFRVEGGPANIEIFGGLTIGHLDPTVMRAKGGGLYDDQNSPALQATGNVDFHIHDWTFGETENWKAATGHVWDGLRLNVTNAYAVDTIVERIWVRGCRDDLIENDSPNAEIAETPSGGTLTFRDSLAEGCFAGISTTNNQRNRVITIDNIALMCTNFFEDEGEGAQFRTFGPMFKPDGSGQTGPRWVVSNSVFAYETWNGAAMTMAGQFGTGRIAEAFRRMTCTNVQMCVLASGTLPSGFPTLPTGMTLLTGQTARDRWNSKRSELITLLNNDVPVGPGFVTRNVASVSPGGLITLDRRLAYPATTFTAQSTGPSSLTDTETFVSSVS